MIRLKLSKESVIKRLGMCTDLTDEEVGQFRGVVEKCLEIERENPKILDEAVKISCELLGRMVLKRFIRRVHPSEIEL